MLMIKQLPPPLPDSLAIYKQVGELFSQHYGKEGSIACFAVDGYSGKPLNAKTLLPELGDYLPLLAVAGEQDYVAEQGRLVREALDPGIQPLNPDSNNVPWLKRQNPFYFTDMILGMLDCYSLGLGDEWLTLAKEQLERLFTLFWKKTGLCKERFLPFGIRLPLAEANTLLFTEILLDLYKISGEQNHLEQAKKILSPWLLCSKQQGVVPRLIPLSSWIMAFSRFQRRSQEYPLYKHNTFFLAALLALAKITGEEEYLNALCQSTQETLAFFTGPQGVPSYMVYRNKGKNDYDVPTLKGTLLADHLFDCYHFLRAEKYLVQAKCMIDFWLKERNERTGLIPYRLGGKRTDVDSLTDFAVSLLKLFALTREKQYLEAARDILASMMNYHWGDFGLYQSVETESGVVRESRVETRFVSLFLKPWILLSAPEAIFDNPLLTSLARDR